MANTFLGKSLKFDDEDASTQTFKGSSLSFDDEAASEQKPSDRRDRARKLSDKLRSYKASKQGVDERLVEMPSIDEVPDDKLDEVVGRLEEEDRQRRMDVFGLVGKGKKHLGKQDDGTDAFEYDAENAPTFALTDDEGKALQSEVEGYSGSTIKHGDRPMWINRDDKGFATGYGTTESTVVPELDGTFSVIPSIWRDKGNGMALHAIDDEDAAAHYRDTEREDASRKRKKDRIQDLIDYRVTVDKGLDDDSAKEKISKIAIDEGLDRGQVEALKKSNKTFAEYRSALSDLASEQHPERKSEGQRFGNFKTEKEAKDAAEKIHQYHEKLYQQKWNQWINEHWDEVSDEIKGNPGVSKTHDEWEKAGRPGIRFTMNLPNDEETPKENIGILEHGAKSLQAATGEEYGKAEAAANNFLPFMRQGLTYEANRRTAALETLRSGEYDDSEMDRIADSQGFLEEARALSGGSRQKMREVLSKMAEEGLVEQTRNKKNAELDLARPLTTWGKIASSTLENSGYVNGFLYGSMMMSGLGVGVAMPEALGAKTIFRLGGKEALKKIGINAVNSAINSMPQTVVGGFEKATGLVNKEYDIDSYDELKVIDNNYSALESGLRGGVSSFIENTVIEGLTDEALSTLALGFSKIPGVSAAIRGVGNGMMKHGVGRMILKCGKLYHDYGRYTQIHSLPGEALEELIDPIRSDVIGLEKRKGEKTDSITDYFIKNYNRENVGEILLGLIGTIGIQGGTAAGQAIISSRSKEARNYAEQVKIARSQLAEVLNAREDKRAAKMLNTLTDEDAVNLSNAYEELCADPKRAEKIADELNGAQGAIFDAMLAKKEYMMNAELEQMGIAPKKFIIPTRKDSLGRPEVDFRKTIVSNLATGTQKEVNCVTDAESGVYITDNGGDAGSNARYTVFDDTTGFRFDCGSIANATQVANAYIAGKTLYIEQDKLKIKFIDGEISRNYGGVDKEKAPFAARTMDEAVAFSLEHGTDVKADKNFRPTRKGWRCNDGTVVIVRDNINTPNEVRELLRHEEVGHDQKMMRSRFLDADEDSQAGQLRETNMERQMEAGPLPQDTTRRIKRESMANTIQRRTHEASWYQKIVHGVKDRLRARGHDIPIGDSDIEVEAEKVEQKLRTGNTEAIIAEVLKDVTEFADAATTVEDAKGTESEKAQEEVSVDDLPEIKDEDTAGGDIRKQYLDAVGENVFDNNRKIAERATEDELNNLIALHKKAFDSSEEADYKALYAAEDAVLKRLAEEDKAAEEAAKPRKQAEVADVVNNAATPFSDEEKTALESAGDMTGIDAQGDVPTQGGYLSFLSSEAPIVRLNPAKVDRSDAVLPNMKKDANRKSGITKPLEGEWHPTMGGIGAAWLSKKGELSVITGRHRSELAERKGKSMLYYLYREAEGFTKEQAQIYDAVANIHDEKGTINDYLQFLDHIKPTREQAEKAGILYGKGLTAWSIHADASEAVRRATALDGNAGDGQITPAQATVIAQAAPKGANKRNAGIQSVLLRTALVGKIKGKAFDIYAKARAEELGNAKINENLLAGEQMDLFTSPEDLAQDILVQRQAQYRTKKANGYEQVATNLRAALNREGKLELTDEYAKDLGVTDKGDKAQLEKAYDLATERADYWANRVLDEADTAAMNAEINAKADATAERLAQLKAKREAAKAGKPLPKKTPAPKAETSVPAATAEKKSAVPTPKKSLEVAKPKRTVTMKSEEEEKRVKSLLDAVEFDSPELDTRNLVKFSDWTAKYKVSPTDKRRQKEFAAKNGIDFDSEEFDYEKFGKLVTGVGKLVDALVENGHSSFESLARYISEADAAKFAKAEPVLQDVWNAIAKQKKLTRVSDDDAERIFGIIHKETEEATDGLHRNDVRRDGSVRATAGGTEDAGRVVAGGRVRTEDSGERVDDLGPRAVPGRAEAEADRTHAEKRVLSGGKAPGKVGAVADRTGTGSGERGAGGDNQRDGDSSATSGRVKKAVAKAAKDTKVAPTHPDFVMTKAVEDAILEPNQAKRIENNIAAIKLVLQTKGGLNDWFAAPEEQAVLAKYVGWGGLSGVFDHNYERAWDLEQSGNAETAKSYARRTSLGLKGYELFKELKGLLDEDMFRSARASSTTAFYTPIPMVRAEHDALRALGLKGGRFLGPSAGVGNYASAMGDYQNAVNWQFVEKDQISGMILKALFPNQRVNVMGFEETKFPDGFFDLAIDNVPYADVPITDKGLSASRFMIHDYFFAKTLAKLRPGGVMMFLTSTGTLDKGSGTLRKFLSEHGGKIIGAVRLPNGFFSQNANTEAAADLVVIQRINGEADNAAFEKLHPFAYEKERHWDRKKREWVEDKKPLSYNKYFADHPEQVIGKMEAVNGQFGKTLNFTMPEGTKDEMFAKVREAIDRALSGVDKDALCKSATVAEKPTHEPIYDEEGLRQGNISVKDGKVYVKSGDMLEPVDVPKDRKLSKELAKRMRTPKQILDGVVKLRKAMRAVVDAEMRGCKDEELKPLLADLNAEYDLFKAKNGSLHDKWVTPFVMLDKADGNRILALERVGKDNVITKADIFTKRVMSIGARVEKAATPKEALVVCYSENGVIVPERISELLGVSVDEAVKALKDSGDAFENPQTGRLEPAWEYLSGHVRTKLAMARAAVESGDASFRPNVEALEKVQPTDVKLEDVEIKFGATWADPEAMKDFLRDSFGVPHLNVVLAKSELTGAWTFELGGTFNGDTPWGKTVWNAEKFIERVLNNGSMESIHTDPMTKEKWRDEAETEANKLAAEKLHQAFGQFLRESEKWSEPSFKRYNDVNNDNVAIKLPDNIMPFKTAGMSDDAMRKLFEDGDPTKPKKGREYQSQVIARGVLGGTSLCLAHCVGAGKTLEMQSIGMLGRHLGMFKKSMYVVPNHMMNQFCNEFIEAFPNANILKMTEDDVKPANRRAFFAQCANGDWDAIVVKHSTFSKKLGMSAEYQMEYAERQMKNLSRAIAEMQEQGDKISVKKAEKMMERLKQTLKDLQDAEGKDAEIVPFEELGVDQLFVDEAHNFKGLPITTRQGRVGGLNQGDSERAVDMEMKTEYVQSLHNGDRGVVFATGTPLSNAPAIESYVFLRYLAPKLLREQGLKHFDDFINAFGRITTETEFSPDGKTTKEKDKVSAFVNIPELMRMFKSRVDIVNSDQLDIPRPTPKYNMISVEMTPTQEAVMEAVAEQSKTPGGKDWKNKYMDMTWVAKYACISPRMLGFTDGGNKIPRMVSEVKKVYDETAEQKGAQLIFTDRFQNGYELATSRVLDGKDAGAKSGIAYNLNEEIKALLVQQGIPENEIAIIQDIDKVPEKRRDDAKEELFAKVRSGEVRVLIGSRAKMGEGTNVQKRLAAIHLLHPGWKPSEDEQAIGRIIRNGNENKVGQIFYYLTKGNERIGSYETKNHELIGVKSRLIQQVMHSDENIRSVEMDESAMDRDMLMGLASGNKALLELIGVRKNTHKLELNSESTATSARRMKDKSEINARALERDREEWKETKTGIEKWRKANDGKEFALTTSDGKTLDKAKDIADYVRSEVVKGLTMDSWERYRHGPFDIGNFNGIPLTLVWNDEESKFYLNVRDLGVVRMVNNVGFVPDFSPQAFSAFKAEMARTADPDYVKNVETGFADREKMVKKQEADSKRLGKEADALRKELAELRRRQEQLEREVTPLLVKVTADHKWATYGNWAIGRAPSGKSYVATKANSDVKIQAPTVREILPKLDEYDFGNPSTSAKKTMDLPQSALGEDHQFETRSVGEVDFFSDEYGVPDPKEDRDFDVIYPNEEVKTIKARSRKQLRMFIDKQMLQGEGVPIKSAIYEPGHGKNAILRLHERRMADYPRELAAGVQALRGEFQSAIREGAYELAGTNARVSDLARLETKGYWRPGEIASLLGNHPLNETDDEGWRFYRGDATTTGTGTDAIVAPISFNGRLNKYQFNQLAANAQLFGNKRFIGFGIQNGKAYALMSAKGNLNYDALFGDKEIRDYLTSHGFEFKDGRWEKDGLGVREDTMVFARDNAGGIVGVSGFVSGIDFDSEEFDNRVKFGDYAEKDELTPEEVDDRVGITNDDIDLRMKALGLKPSKHVKVGMDLMHQQAEVLLSSPSYMEKLIKAVGRWNNGGRGVAPHENLAIGMYFNILADEIEAQKEYLDGVQKLIDSGEIEASSVENYENDKKEFGHKLSMLAQTEVAKKRGVGNAARTMLTNRDTIRLGRKFGGIVSRVSAAYGLSADGGIKLPAQMMDEIKELADEFKRIDKAEIEYYANRWVALSKETFSKQAKEIKMRTAVSRKDEEVAVTKKYLDAMIQIEVAAKNGDIDLFGLQDNTMPGFGKWLKAIAEYHIMTNPSITADPETAEEKCIEAMLEDVRTFLPNVDANSIRRAYTGYGHHYKQSNRETQAIMNDIRGQSLSKLQLKTMREENTLPPVTGMERDEPSDVRRRLAKEVQEEKKLTPEGSEHSLKGVMESARKRLENRIADLKHAIDTKTAIPRKERRTIDDIDIINKRKEVEELQKQYDEIFKTKRELTDEERVRMAEKAMSSVLEGLAKEIADARRGVFTGGKRTELTSETLKVLRDKAKEYRKEIRDLKKAAYMYGMTPAEIMAHNRRIIENLRKRVERKAEWIETGNRPATKEKLPMTKSQQEAYKQLRKDNDAANAKLRQLEEDARRATWIKPLRVAIDTYNWAAGGLTTTAASYDRSAVLRQTIKLSLAHPAWMAKFMKEAEKAAWNRDWFEEVNEKIMNDPIIQEAVSKFGLKIRSADIANVHDVEQFAVKNVLAPKYIQRLGDLVGKVPVAGWAGGKVAKFNRAAIENSERHYITYINLMAAQQYKALCDAVPGGASDFEKRKFAGGVNILTGASSMPGKMRSAINTINTLGGNVQNIIWSPSLWMSQIQQRVGADVWGVYIGHARDVNDPESRKERMKERNKVALEFAKLRVRAELATLMLGFMIAWLWSDDDWWDKFKNASTMKKVEMMRHPVIGKTHIDLEMGERSFAKFVEHAISGSYETSTGRTMSANTYGYRDVWSHLGRYIGGKTVPYIGRLISLSQGMDYSGNPYGWKEFAIDHIPLSIGDVYDSAVNDNWKNGQAEVAIALTLLGAGGNVYDEKYYEQAINPFREAKKEYDAIVMDGELSEEERAERLSKIVSDNPIMSDEVRDNIAAKIAFIRQYENGVKKSTNPSAKELENIEMKKREVLNEIRAARR